MYVDHLNTILSSKTKNNYKKFLELIKFYNHDINSTDEPYTELTDIFDDKMNYDIHNPNYLKSQIEENSLLILIDPRIRIIIEMCSAHIETANKFTSGRYRKDETLFKQDYKTWSKRADLCKKNLLGF